MKILIKILTLKITLFTYLTSLVFAGDAQSMKNQNVKNGHVVTKDQKKIYFDHYKNNHPKVIILAHGYFNSKKAILFKDMAKDLNDQYDVIIMDFRGHGESDGPFVWTAKEYQDLEAILEYAKKEYKDIGVIGFSLGAATSIIVAAQTDLITSLIVVSPPTDFDKIEKHFWKMKISEALYNVIGEGRIGKGVRMGNLWLKKTRPIDVVQDIKIPTLFIHGKKDWLILPWHSEKLYEKIQGNKKLIMVEKGTHSEYIYRSDKEGTINMFKDWFNETL
ncbi:MAG: alpha/beta fold hydrolase [Candidatus Omnitrophica bacterium]|nr:alpha/beta fold hydrolase [Candidatus Omnitrophota bacterium]